MRVSDRQTVACSSCKAPEGPRRRSGTHASGNHGRCSPTRSRRSNASRDGAGECGVPRVVARVDSVPNAIASNYQSTRRCSSTKQCATATRGLGMMPCALPVLTSGASMHMRSVAAHRNSMVCAADGNFAPDSCSTLTAPCSAHGGMHPCHADRHRRHIRL